MRGTSHNGRAGKYGVYSPKHNDRNFDMNNADHIDQSKSIENVYWHRYANEDPYMTFEEVERRFYEETFTDALEAKNERYRKSGHKEDVKTMDEYRQSKLSCPEETILQIGKAGDTVDPKQLMDICKRHIGWESMTFPNVEILDMALHVDEQGAPHIHVRKVWVADTPEGAVVGQAKSLKQMGIERPDPNKKNDRYNNPKMTYTKMCRDHFVEVCKRYGIELEVEPKEASKTGLTLTEYQRQQEQEKAEQARQEVEIAKQEREAAEQARLIAEQAQRETEEESRKIKQQNKDLQSKNDALIQENSEICDENEAVRAANKRLQDEKDALTVQNNQKQAELDALTAQNAQKQTELETVNKNITEAQNALRKAKEELQQVQDKSIDLECITAQVDAATKQLGEILDMKVKAAEIHKPKIFQDKETLTYNKSMMESIKSIGTNASERMKTAQETEIKNIKLEKDIKNRENKVKQKENEIEPLYEKVTTAKKDAEEYKSKIEEYINAEASKLIEEIAPQQDKLSDKMREFMERYYVEGKSLVEIFDEKQEQERQKQQKELERRTETLIRNRNYRDMEL